MAGHHLAAVTHSLSRNWLLDRTAPFSLGETVLPLWVSRAEKLARVMGSGPGPSPGPSPGVQRWLVSTPLSPRDPGCEMGLGPRALSGRSPASPLGKRPGCGAVALAKTGLSWNYQAGSVFREPEGLVEPRARPSNHSGPLCGGLVWTRPEACPWAGVGPAFGAAARPSSQTTQRQKCEMGSSSSSRQTPTGLSPGPEFPPPVFLESTCLNDFTQSEKSHIPNQTRAPAGQGQASPPQAH